MSHLPPLNLASVPRQPAGLPSTYSSRATRLKYFFEAQRGETFGSYDAQKPKHLVAISPHQLQVVDANKRRFNSWLARWDRDPGIGRFLILDSFLKHCNGFSHSQLDDLFGNASELVFTHIYAFFRLNYQRACSIALQLKALRIFFDASSGYCFAHQFLSGSGPTLLLDLIKMSDNLSPEDLTEILETFLSLTAHGPKARQFLADTKLVTTFTAEIPKFRSPELHKMTVLLFSQLAEGEERRPGFRFQFRQILAPDAKFVIQEFNYSTLSHLGLISSGESIDARLTLNSLVIPSLHIIESIWLILTIANNG
jgi:hypothetical protein